MASVTTFGLVLGSVAIATFSATRLTAPVADRSTMSAAHSVSEPAVARVVTVTGKDFSFDAPDVLPAGLTEFRFVNRGPALHHLAIVKLAGNKTLPDLLGALAKPGPFPAWAKEMGGPNAPVPGAESNATVLLEPGNYALICFVDLGGPPHFVKGMSRAMRVVPSKAPAGSFPKADATMTLFDYNFKLSAPLRAGTRTIRVHNAAKQHHEVELVQLAPGVHTDQFMKWMEKMEGEPLGKAVGGIAGMEAGMTQSFSVNLQPGNYLLICFLPDSKDGKPHLAHGMLQEIAVK
jgi:hypothetical protein